MPAGAAAALTRDAVVDEAAKLVAEDGYEGLNMRALAERLDVAPMTLYRHVQTKEDLLGALADRMLEQIELPDAGSAPWQDEVVTVFRSMHSLCLAHPELAEIAARQRVAGRAAYRGAEAVLAALRRGGIHGEAAAAAFAGLVAFTLGFVLQQIHSSSPEALGRRLALLEGLPAEEYPEVKALGTGFLVRDSDRAFEEGLQALLAGFANR
jgi:AcrR family transcriptional regulator